MHRKINKNFFKKWAREMAYILGFLFADGSISVTNRGGYYFSFHSADQDLLLKIKELMASDHKVSKRSIRSGNVYRLQIGSKEMIDDLDALKLRETKTKRMEFPDVPKIFLADFIRGYFDGDGNVWMGLMHKERKIKTMSLQVAFTSSSREFLTDLHKTLRGLEIKGGSIFGIKNKNCSRLLFSTKDSLQLSKIMYNDECSSLFLARKKRVFERYIEQNMRS
ncbi:MAG: LAGLIDADG family homing endonuclease [Candidatus Paceibacterota bacterium]|jgi:intein/homing endonuclease